MGIATQVVEDFLWSSEGLFGMDVPILFAKRLNEAREALRRSQASSWTGEPEVGGGLVQALQEFSSKDPAERFDVEQEVVASGDPASAVKRQGAAGDQTMEVEVRTKSLIPGVEHGQKGELASQMSPAKIEQRLGDRVEQQRQQDLLVGQNQGVQFMGEGEDQMEVTDGQQFDLTILQPASLL